MVKNSLNSIQVEKTVIVEDNIGRIDPIKIKKAVFVFDGTSFAKSWGNCKYLCLWHVESGYEH